MNTLLPTTFLQRRRDNVFLVLSGLFLGTLGVINMLGVTRFADLSITLGTMKLPIILPMGMLPYPITFLCTDIICEFYGKERASAVVWVGFLVNIWIFFIVWLGGILPPHVEVDPTTQLPPITHSDYHFYKIRLFCIGGIISSMIAYIVAQLIDVYLYQFWKKFTKGKHLWLRTNGSTLISQFVDTVIVLTLTIMLTGALPFQENENIFLQLTTIIYSSYTFKLFATLFCTIPFYISVLSLRKYFRIDTVKDFDIKPNKSGLYGAHGLTVFQTEKNIP